MHVCVLQARAVAEKAAVKKFEETKAKLDVIVKREAKAGQELKAMQKDLKDAKDKAAADAEAVEEAKTRVAEVKAKATEATRAQKKLEDDLKTALQMLESAKQANARVSQQASEARAKMAAEEEAMMTQAAEREANLKKELKSVKTDKMKAQEVWK